NFARPNDYWFHTRTASGSHCVLRMSGGKSPTKEIIEKAAQIAAYFSKARNSDYVPVSYTQRKFVRKAKRGETGSAVLIREDVIFVEPKKPEAIEFEQNFKNET
ncbi:MAG: NFACT RNA binding domain-containing protein, partial [Candidatus Kapaibacteriota bacterium]